MGRGRIAGNKRHAAHADHGRGIIGADGLWSKVRGYVAGEQKPRVSGHIAYRAVIPTAELPSHMQENNVVLHAGPKSHLVHYPLRSGDQYNLVVTFHSREQEVWDVRDGSKEEVLSYFTGIAPLPRKLLDATAEGTDPRLFALMEEACSGLLAARERGQGKPIHGPNEATRIMADHVSSGHKVGILFGRERTGLENEDIALADAIERERPLLRFQRWRVEPAEGGGVRLSGVLIGATR